MGSLDRHSAIITGVALALGAATARRMAGEGAQVAVFDVNRDASTAVNERDVGWHHARSRPGHAPWPNRRAGAPSPPPRLPTRLDAPTPRGLKWAWHCE